MFSTEEFKYTTVHKFSTFSPLLFSYLFLIIFSHYFSFFLFSLFLSSPCVTSSLGQVTSTPFILEIEWFFYLFLLFFWFLELRVCLSLMTNFSLFFGLQPWKSSLVFFGGFKVATGFLFSTNGGRQLMIFVYLWFQDLI